MTKFSNLLGTGLVNYDNVNLVLDGIDTVAEVSINGKTVLLTENMFRQYVTNVKTYLNVSICFISTIFLIRKV